MSELQTTVLGHQTPEQAFMSQLSELESGFGELLKSCAEFASEDRLAIAQRLGELAGCIIDVKQEASSLLPTDKSLHSIDSPVIDISSNKIEATEQPEPEVVVAPGSISSIDSEEDASKPNVIYFEDLTDREQALVQVLQSNPGITMRPHELYAKAGVPKQQGGGIMTRLISKLGTLEPPINICAEGIKGGRTYRFEPMEKSDAGSTESDGVISPLTHWGLGVANNPETGKTSFYVNGEILDVSDMANSIIGKVVSTSEALDFETLLKYVMAELPDYNLVDLVNSLDEIKSSFNDCGQKEYWYDKVLQTADGLSRTITIRGRTTLEEGNPDFLD